MTNILVNVVIILVLCGPAALVSSILEKVSDKKKTATIVA